MRKILIALIVSTLVFNLTACETKQEQGVLGGAALGGLVGAQFGSGNRTAGILAGAIIGGLIGGAIGKNMDDIDRMNMNHAVANNETATWRNPNTGYQYTVVPGNDVAYKGNQNCREFATTANVGGKQEQIFGTACRQSDGSWRVVQQ